MQNLTNFSSEIKKSQEILKGNIVRTILSIVIPLFLYNLLNYFYDVYDTIIISASGIGNLESIVMLSQIKVLVATLGSAVISGAAILIARKIGSKELEQAKKLTNTLFYFLLIIGAITLVVFIPFGTLILKLLQTPVYIINSAYGYFIVQIVSVVVELINSLFIAISQTKGKTAKIFYLNLGVTAIKLILSSLAAFGGFAGITTMHLAGATLIAQLFMLCFAIHYLFKKDSIVPISLKIRLDKSSLIDIIKISLPIFAGTFLFYYSKVFISARLSIFYGAACVGVLGLSNTMIGVNQQFINAISSSASSMVGQNYGVGNIQRIKGIFKSSLVLCLSSALVWWLILFLFSSPIAKLLCGANIENFTLLLTFIALQKYELFADSLYAACGGVINGLGKTKINMFSNILRSVILRIPLLFILYYVFNIGNLNGVIILLISNGLGSIILLIITLCYINKRLKKKINLNLVNA